MWEGHTKQPALQLVGIHRETELSGPVDDDAGIRASKTICAQLLQFPEGRVHFKPVSHRSIAVPKPAVDFRPRKQGVAAGDFVWMRTSKKLERYQCGEACIPGWFFPLASR